MESSQIRLSNEDIPTHTNEMELMYLIRCPLRGRGHAGPHRKLPSQPPCPAAGQAGSTNPPCFRKKKESEVLLSLSLVFNCRSKLALQAGAACQQLLLGRLPGHPSGEGCPSHPPPCSSSPACSYHRQGQSMLLTLPTGCCGN